MQAALEPISSSRAGDHQTSYHLFKFDRVPVRTIQTTLAPRPLVAQHRQERQRILGHLRGLLGWEPLGWHGLRLPHNIHLDVVPHIRLPKHNFRGPVPTLPIGRDMETIFNKQPRVGKRLRRATRFCSLVFLVANLRHRRMVRDPPVHLLDLRLPRRGCRLAIIVKTSLRTRGVRVNGGSIPILGGASILLLETLTRLRLNEAGPDDPDFLRLLSIDITNTTISEMILT